MKHNLKAQLIALIVPLLSIAQVQFQKTSSLTINTILPF